MYTDLIKVLKVELAELDKKRGLIISILQQYDPEFEYDPAFEADELALVHTNPNLIPAAKVALEKFSMQAIFKAEDVFKAIGRDDIDFDKARTTLSRFLSQEAEAGRLEKVTRGNYRRVSRAAQLNKVLADITPKDDDETPRAGRRRS